MAPLSIARDARVAEPALGQAPCRPRTARSRSTASSTRRLLNRCLDTRVGKKPPFAFERYGFVATQKFCQPLNRRARVIVGPRLTSRSRGSWSYSRNEGRDKPIYRTNARLFTMKKAAPPPEKHAFQISGRADVRLGRRHPRRLLAKTDGTARGGARRRRARAWTAVRRRRLGSEAVQPPPPSFLSS